MSLWDHPRLAYFLLGVFSLMSVVLAHYFIGEWLYWRAQRPIILRWAKMCGLRRMPGESLRSLRDRVRKEMRI